MSSNLTSYQSHYGSLTAEITSNITRLVSNRKDSQSDQEDDKKAIVEKIDKNFEDATELFEQMELEIRELSSSEERSRQSTQLDSFKAELKRLRKEHLNAKRKNLRNQERKTLFGGSNNSSKDEEEDLGIGDAQDRLLDNTERLDRSSRKLDQGQNVLSETQSIGVSVLNDLEHQKEVLTRSRNRIRDTDDDLGTSSRVLSIMIMRVQKSRILLALVVVAIIAAIIFGIYLSIYG